MKKHSYERKIVAQIFDKLQLEFIHILIGPRQVGKTTGALQLKEKWKGESIYASADEPLPPGPEWIETHFERAIAKSEPSQKVLLILDEIQKIKGWSEVVKKYWDMEKRQQKGIRVVLMGSSSLLLQKGLTESLAGRFLLYRFTHWNYTEMKKAFGWSLDQWIFYGGYPGAAPLIKEPTLWRSYISDSLIEAVLAKDVLELQTVTKPALLRHLFSLATIHPAEIFSYNKMLGQLQDVGNTTTLAHYVKLLESAFIVSGLENFREGQRIKRGTSPKLILWNNALINGFLKEDIKDAKSNPSWWGRLVENAVGAYLLNHLAGVSYDIYYFREKDNEVDFVIKTPKDIWAIEVKSGRAKGMSGLRRFKEKYPKAKVLILGSSGMPLEEFFGTEPESIF